MPIITHSKITLIKNNINKKKFGFKMILIYVPCKDEEEAVKISKRLLEKRLVACTNVHPIRSFYRWEGKIQDDREFVIIAKTSNKKYDDIKDEVKKIHSYDVPCI